MKSQGRLSDPWLTWVLTMYRLRFHKGQLLINHSQAFR